MAQHYSDPTRESDPHALPDLEVYWQDPGAIDVGGEVIEPGWYWVACFPGCLPDGEPTGPFETEQEALDDARSEAPLEDLA